MASNRNDKENVVSSTASLALTLTRTYRRKALEEIPTNRTYNLNDPENAEILGRVTRRGQNASDSSSIDFEISGGATLVLSSDGVSSLSIGTGLGSSRCTELVADKLNDERLDGESRVQAQIEALTSEMREEREAMREEREETKKKMREEREEMREEREETKKKMREEREELKNKIIALEEDVKKLAVLEEEFKKIAPLEEKVAVLRDEQFTREKLISDVQHSSLIQLALIQFELRKAFPDVKDGSDDWFYIRKTFRELSTFALISSGFNLSPGVTVNSPVQPIGTSTSSPSSHPSPPEPKFSNIKSDRKEEIKATLFVYLQSTEGSSAMAMLSALSSIEKQSKGAQNRLAHPIGTDRLFEDLLARGFAVACQGEDWASSATSSEEMWPLDGLKANQIFDQGNWVDLLSIRTYQAPIPRNSSKFPRLVGQSSQEAGTVHRPSGGRRGVKLDASGSGAEQIEAVIQGVVDAEQHDV